MDCGITAFELSDYSPGDEPETREPGEPGDEKPGQNQEPGLEENQESPLEHFSNPDLSQSADLLACPGQGDKSAVPSDSLNPTHSLSTAPTMQCGGSNHSEGSVSKRLLQGESHSSEVSPTQPSLPKRAALFSPGDMEAEEAGAGLGNFCLASGFQFQAELSRSSPSLLDPPDRSKFCLELNSVYPGNVSQSYESLQVCLFVVVLFDFLLICLLSLILYRVKGSRAFCVTLPARHRVGPVGQIHLVDFHEIW